MGHYSYGCYWKNKFNRAVTKKNGFTLIEVMAAAAITVPMLIILMQIVPGMLKVGTKVEVVTRATFLAEKKMEEIRCLIHSDNGSYGFSRDYNESATAFPAPDPRYKYSVVDSGGAKIKDLLITAWRDDNSNDTVDSDEYAVAFDTKAAK